MSKRKALFLCKGNSARSQMAEALLRMYAGDAFEVHSAGLEPKGINPYTIQVMQELGYDMSGHHAKPVRTYLGRETFHYAITVCDHAEQNCPRFFPGTTQVLHWPFEDPASFEGTDEDTLSVFRSTREQIASRLRNWLVEIEAPVR